MKLNQIRDFLAVARAGGVRAAARELGLSQPAVSKSVQQLEAHLDAPLFERSGKGAVLTPFGDAFLVRARSVINELERAQDELQQLRGTQDGQVSIALTGIPFLSLLPGALRTFRQRFPQTRLRVVERRYDVTLADLRDGALDFAVMPEPMGSLGDPLSVQTILRDRTVVIGRRGHPLRGVASLRELLGVSWVVTRYRGETAAEFESIFKRQRLPVPRMEIQCESVIGVLSLVANSDLLAYLPRRWLDSTVTRGLVEEIPVGAILETAPICLVRKSGLPLTPAADALANAIVVEANALMAAEESPAGSTRRARPA